MASENIFAQYAQPVKSVADYTAEADQRDMRMAQLQGAQRQNALASLMYGQQVQDAQAKAADTNAIRGAYAQAGGDQNKLMAILRGPSATIGTIAHANDVEAAGLKRQQTESEVSKNNAQAGEFTANAGKATQATSEASRKAAVQQIAALGSPEEASAALDSAAKSGAMPQPVADGFKRLVATDPKWQVKLMLAISDPDKAAEIMMPHLSTVNTGGQTVAMSTDKLTGKPTITGQVTNTQSPDNAATNAAHVQTTAMTNATRRANNAANITTDFAVAGVNPDGSPMMGNEKLIDAIGTGKMAPPSGLALNHPRMQQILAQVAAKYPEFDATDYQGRLKAARDFSTGPQGRQAQSFNVALAHLDTLGQLADALGNGNTQIVNKVGNFFATQTGAPAPTDFNAAKKIVGDEVTKAIIGAGGGVGDREAAQKVIDAANSPAQLSGVIKTYKEMMVGQLGGLEQTYLRTTGRQDFRGKFLSPEAQALVNSHSQAANSVPPAVAAALAKPGAK